MSVFWLSKDLIFPPVHLATREGLLAVGGDLSCERLILAYRNGIFPWYSEHEPILWWSPDPRLVLYPSNIHISRSLRKLIHKRRFRITLDRAFERVIHECARVRLESYEETWIGSEMIAAYMRLHEKGLAHSVEAWDQGNLVGGLYGVSLGRCFFGESMFSRTSNASKMALAMLAGYLEARCFQLIDCQVTTAHLMRMGAREISRERFINELRVALKTPTLLGPWHIKDVSRT